ncbi:MAG: COG2426 family protein [Patescibacteria group bacterium]
MLQQLSVIFMYALTPIGELRLAIPLGLTQYELPVALVYIVAVIGNMIPPILILYGLPLVADNLRSRSKRIDHFLNWLFERTRRKTEKHMKKYGPLGLMLFVAIPLPNTGAWTGSLAAWLFGVPKKTALMYTLFGVMIAGIVVTLLTFGAQNIF